MGARLVGGPFDGAPSSLGDPGVPVLWLRMLNGELRWLGHKTPGRVRYCRAGEGLYVYDPNEDGNVGELWAREVMTA